MTTITRKKVHPPPAADQPHSKSRLKTNFPSHPVIKGYFPRPLTRLEVRVCSSDGYINTATDACCSQHRQLTLSE